MGDFSEAMILSYEKTVVLNAIYDVMDTLGLAPEHINSEQGVVVIRAPEQAAMRITVSTVFPSRSTKIGIACQDGEASEWAAAFFDELNSTLAGGYGKDTAGRLSVGGTADKLSL